MNSEYNSRQRKIYHDYITYSSDSLFEIIKNSNNYIPEVIEVINDILIERNLILPGEKREEEGKYENEKYLTVNLKEEEYFNEEKHSNDEVVKKYMTLLDEKSDSDLSEIITRYISYEPETVEAALIISVKRGIISYDLKELLLKQIQSNFTLHRKKIKKYYWEAENAFTGYVSGYNDDEIYDIIEDPADIVIDVYHAVLVNARVRELISEDDFTTYLNEAKPVIRTEQEIRKDEIEEFFNISNPADDFENEAEFEAEKEKFRKCPSCNQLVGIEFDVCWNCQTGIPENAEHPDRQDIIKERAMGKKFSPVRSGLMLIGGGVFVGLLGLEKDYFLHYHYGRFVFGTLIILFGLVIIIFGRSIKKDTI
jgi:hypothetical protein